MLDQYSDKDLRAELKKREQERKQEAINEQNEHENFIIEHIDAILELLPAHFYKHCSDQSFLNYKHCCRCAALRIKTKGYIPSRVRLEVTLKDIDKWFYEANY